jgi:hypothetical protein
MASTALHVRDYRQIPGTLVNNTWEFPNIESINKNNKKTFWKIYVRLIDTRLDISLD